MQIKSYCWLLCLMILVQPLLAQDHISLPIYKSEGHTCIHLQGQHIDQHSFLSSQLRENKTSGYLDSEPNILVLLIDFSDAPQDISTEEVEQIFNKRTIESHPSSGGFKDYFHKNSYGTFSPNSTIAGWYRAKHPYSYYKDVLSRWDAADSLFYEAMAAAAADPEIDLSLFDNDGDGESEGVIVLPTRSIVAQARFFKNAVYDGVEFTKFAMSYINKDNLRMGTTTHEYGHILGLPDLYLTNEPIGLYCLMSHAKGAVPGNFCAWSKVQLGWVEPILIEGKKQSLDIPASNARPFVLKMLNDSYQDGRYFLIENRVFQDYDDVDQIGLGGGGRMQGEGLLIYHVDDSRVNEWVRVIQADGQDDMGKWNRSNGQEGNVGDPGDYFPGTTGNRVFNGKSTPSSLSFFEEDLGLEISNISDPGEVMRADFTPIVPQGNTLRIQPDFMHIYDQPAFSKTPFAGTQGDSIWGGDVYESLGMDQIEAFTYFYSGRYDLPGDIYDAQKVNLKLYKNFDANRGEPKDLFYEGRFDVELPADGLVGLEGSFFITARAIVWLDQPVSVPSSFFATYAPIRKNSDPLNGNILMAGLSKFTNDEAYASYYAFGEDFPRFRADARKYYTLHFYASKGGNTTNISPQEKHVSFILYPNPAKDRFYLENPYKRAVKLSIRNLLGQEISRHNLKQGGNDIRSNHLSPGTYLLIFEGTDRTVESHLKLVIDP